MNRGLRSEAEEYRNIKVRKADLAEEVQIGWIMDGMEYVGRIGLHDGR